MTGTTLEKIRAGRNPATFDQMFGLIRLATLNTMSDTQIQLAGELMQTQWSEEDGWGGISTQQKNSRLLVVASLNIGSELVSTGMLKIFPSKSGITTLEQALSGLSIVNLITKPEYRNNGYARMIESLLLLQGRKIMLGLAKASDETALMMDSGEAIEVGEGRQPFTQAALVAGLEKDATLLVSAEAAEIVTLTGHLAKELGLPLIPPRDFVMTTISTEEKWMAFQQRISGWTRTRLVGNFKAVEFQAATTWKWTDVGNQQFEAEPGYLSLEEFENAAKAIPDIQDRRSLGMGALPMLEEDGKTALIQFPDSTDFWLKVS